MLRRQYRARRIGLSLDCDGRVIGRRLPLRLKHDGAGTRITTATRHVNSFILDICFIVASEARGQSRLLLHVALEHLAADDGAVHVPRASTADALRAPAVIGCGRFRVFDEMR